MKNRELRSIKSVRVFKLLNQIQRADTLSRILPVKRPLYYRKQEFTDKKLKLPKIVLKDPVEDQRISQLEIEWYDPKLCKQSNKNNIVE